MESTQTLSQPSCQPVPARGFFQTRIVLPLIDLLRVGASPRRLAWSLAVGAAIGINPILGSTTLLCLLVACILRLNLIASQIANHVLFPLQLALVLIYLRVGESLFHTGPLPLKKSAFVHAIRHKDWATAHLLWKWEWHAIVVWMVFAAVLTPVLASALHPVLSRLLARMQRENATT